MLKMIVDIGYLTNVHLISIEGNLKDRQDFTLPTWGIISNSGRASFIDYNGNVKNYMESGFLSSPQKVTISITNTLTSYSENVGSYYTEKWSYDETSKTVNVTFSDRFKKLQDVTDGTKYFRYYNMLNSKRALDIYNMLVSVTESALSLFAFNSLDKDTKEWLESIEIKYPFFEIGNLWSYWKKFGEFTQTHIFIDKNGNGTCKYNGGN